MRRLPFPWTDRNVPTCNDSQTIIPKNGNKNLSSRGISRSTSSEYQYPSLHFYLYINQNMCPFFCRMNFANWGYDSLHELKHNFFLIHVWKGWICYLPFSGSNIWCIFNFFHNMHLFCVCFLINKYLFLYPRLSGYIC